MKTSIPPVLITFALVCFALVRNTQAVLPPPDGGYPGGNTAEGQNALQSLSGGAENTALGYQALFHDTTGFQNTATGYQALFSDTTGRQSVANGSQALYSNTTGWYNTATGFRTLYWNTTGCFNTGNGFVALAFNTTGAENTAVGSLALYINTTGNDNTANGFEALSDNTTGFNNTAIGAGALFSNTSGESNTATGERALSSTGTGSNNTANGTNTLSGGRNGNVTAGWSNNTAVGANALIGGIAAIGDLDNNTAVGAGTLPLSMGGQNNIAIGYQAGSNVGGLGPANNNIEIGNPGDPAGSDGDTIRIGDVQTRAFNAGIYGTTTGSTTTLPVIVDSNGQLGTAPSSRRFKKDIKPMEGASQSILALKPVSFHYKSDTTNTPQFGLVAEQVAAVNDALIVRDKNGKPYTVRYDQVNAMLLNEFLKEHRKVEDLEATIAQLKKDFRATVAQLATRLDEQAAQIQKVSAQLEVSKPAPQTVLNSQ
jgi:hypothetical protein